MAKDKSETIEQTMWTAANKLRKNMDAAEYKHIVLGLIFLKFISDKFEELHQKLLKGEGDYEGADPEDPDEYTAENIFYVPEKARWTYLQERAKSAGLAIGKDVDDAMEAIETLNPSLENVLPKDYAKENLDKASLSELIDLISNSLLDTHGEDVKDILGRIYEYFLGKFALAEGKKGGQFYTPSCIVQLLVDLLQPYEGRVFDPCCGSGGMFVQSEKFVERHKDIYNNQNEFGKLFDKVVSIYGQESNLTTWRLCKMNLALRGIDSSNVKWNVEGSFLKDAHQDLKADFIIANPPFNDGDWSGDQLKNDYRWKYGEPPESNANYAWIQHFISHLSTKGKAGFLLAVKSVASESNAETEIRKGIVKDNLPECIILLPGKLFYTTPAPVSLWILSRDYSKRNNETLFIDASKICSPLDRTHNQLLEKDRKVISETYLAWINKSTEYKDIPGFCKSVKHQELLDKNCSLYPGEYIGVDTDSIKTKSVEDSKKALFNNIEQTKKSFSFYTENLIPLLTKLENEKIGDSLETEEFELGDFLYESNDILGNNPEPEILTCTENAGLVLQRERFSKRVATDDTHKYKIVRRTDIVYNPYLLWAGAIDQCNIVDIGITSPAYTVLRVKEGFSPDLIGYVLKTEYMKKCYWNISIGTHERRRTAPVEKFLKLKIKLPKIETQKIIQNNFDSLNQQIINLSNIQRYFRDIRTNLNEIYSGK